LVSPTAIQSTSNGEQSAPPPTPSAEPSTCSVQSSSPNSNKPSNGEGVSSKNTNEGSMKEPAVHIVVQSSDILEKAQAAIAAAERASAAARAAAQLVSTNFGSLKLEESKS